MLSYKIPRIASLQNYKSENIVTTNKTATHNKFSETTENLHISASSGNMCYVLVKISG